MKKIAEYKATIYFDQRTEKFGIEKIFFCNDYEVILKELNQICVEAKDMKMKYNADIQKFSEGEYKTCMRRSYAPSPTFDHLSQKDQYRIELAKKIRSIDWEDALRLEQESESEEARDFIKTIRISLYHSEEGHDV